MDAPIFIDHENHNKIKAFIWFSTLSFSNVAAAILRKIYFWCENPGRVCVLCSKVGKKDQAFFSCSIFFWDARSGYDHDHGHVYRIPNSGTPERIFASGGKGQLISKQNCRKFCFQIYWSLVEKQGLLDKYYSMGLKI